jgi:hypothetical protein
MKKKQTEEGRKNRWKKGRKVDRNKKRTGRNEG